MSVEILDNLVRISLSHQTQEISLNSPNILKLLEKINNLLSSLRENNFDWKANNNLLVFETVSSSITVLKMIKKYKKLSMEDKKNICFQLVEKLIENEIKTIDISPEMKNLAQNGIDTIIEPLIELSIITILQPSHTLLKFCPCLKTK